MLTRFSILIYERRINLMKQIKILGVLAVALTLGLTACGGKAECKKHKWGEYVVTQEETCTQDGKKQRKCTVCGKVEEAVIKAGHKWGEYIIDDPATCSAVGHQHRVCERCQEQEAQSEIPMIDHTYGEWDETTNAPTCTEAGSRTRTCLVCGHEDTEDLQALGHNFTKDADGNDIVTWTKEVSCEEDGVGTKHCERCNEDIAYTQQKLGHHLVQQADDGTTVPEGHAKVRVYECDRDGCDYATFGFKATETSPNSGRLVEVTTTNEKGEEEVGKRFWGRPIGNDVELNDEGSASQDSHEAVYNPETQGDLFEYIFTLSDAQVAALGNDIVCYADAKPSDYMNSNGPDFWAAGSGEEWTPGYYIEGENAGQPITDYRYILYVDDAPVSFDETMPKAPVGRGDPRGEYLMPYLFHFTAGQHKISLRMAGGYRSVFYNFIFKSYEAPEPPEPQHVHDFASETDVAAKGEGYVGYKTATCAEDSAKRINIRALDGTFAEGSANKTGNGAPLEGYMKLAKNENSISYKFDYAGQAATAKLYQYGYMDNFSSNGDRTYTSAQDSSKLAKSPTGTNFAVKFNNADVAISDATKATTYTQFFAGATVSPGGNGNSNLAACYIGDVQLQNGDNTFIFTRYESFNLSVSNFYLVIE